MVYTMAKEARENNERNSAEGREDRGMKGLSYRCGDAKTPLLYETIGEHFDRMAEAHRDREALVVAHQGFGGPTALTTRRWRPWLRGS